MKRYVLEVVVFICGAAVMIFELTGSRVLAPYVGTSIFVWSSLIGVILGSLSLGYWWGGRVADRRPTPQALSLVILGAAVLIAGASAGKTGLLRFLFFHVRDPRWNSLLASIALFAAGSVLLGMVSPYAARLRMRALDASGRTVGNLYAISTVGSITGTFVAGFYLIPRFGNTTILFILAGLLLFASILLAPRGRLPVRAAGVALIVVFCTAPGRTKSLQIETQYNSVMIGEAPHPPTGRTIRIMALNSQDSSAMFLESDDLVHTYTKYYHLASHFRPDFKTALMLGGAAYSFPRDYVVRYPEASIDVVEIDPKVTELARE
jgi:predicted membrane-bound spermidine synthase